VARRGKTTQLEIHELLSETAMLLSRVKTWRVCPFPLPDFAGYTGQSQPTTGKWYAFHPDGTVTRYSNDALGGVSVPMPQKPFSSSAKPDFETHQ
jgi:hypothetical protein